MAKLKLSDYLFYIIYSTFTATLYGVFVYFVIYRLLANSNMLYAYLLNTISMIAFLFLDKLGNNQLLSKNLKIDNDAVWIYLTSMVSFKTTLYLFYAFVLIVSRVSLLEPELINPDFRSFVLSIEYTLVLLVAYDKFFEHLTKDDQRLRKISKKFDKFFNTLKKQR
ncbi:MAG: hypothetical protein FWF50_02250 [Defluviitaleaceae bacterium]|nr:hypothetical protein [Defluviitaleaceae bacterium]